MASMAQFTILTLAGLILISSFQVVSGNIRATSCKTHRIWGQTRRCISTFILPSDVNVHKRKGFSNKLNPDETRRNFPLALMQKNGDEDDVKPNSSIDKIQRSSRDEWISGHEMMQIMAKQEQRRQSQREPTNDFNKEAPINLVSRISYSDANTLQIELPAAGLNANTAVSGAFAAVWFGAIAPATLSMLSAGVVPALFMTPFWLAGGLVAKTTVYDPFVSSKLSIGDYLWTLERNYLKRSNTIDGPTANLKGATVEVAIVVNDVPSYELQLFTNDGKVTGFARGLDVVELEYLSRLINDHISKCKQSINQ